NSGKGIDEGVGDMRELKRPPFSGYDAYRLLAKKLLPLEKGSPKTYRLPNGRTLKTELKEQPGPDTFKISASINQPKGKAFLPLLEVSAGLGQSFIVAGQTYQAGILVLVLKVIKGLSFGRFRGRGMRAHLSSVRTDVTAVLSPAVTA